LEITHSYVDSFTSPTGGFKAPGYSTDGIGRNQERSKWYASKGGNNSAKWTLFYGEEAESLSSADCKHARDIKIKPKYLK
jgi:hypothetical protein